MSVLVLVGLGSNLGDRRAVLDRAVASLDSTSGMRLRSVSSYHGTSPVGGPEGQGSFLNAVALVQTSLDARSVLARLHEIEHEAGRKRSVRWGERTLDLDLLLYGHDRLNDPTLTVPHPRMAVRRFVLEPAAEIAPRLTDPRTHRTIRQLLANLNRSPPHLAVVAPPGVSRDLLIEALGAGIGAHRIRRSGRTDAELLDSGIGDDADALVRDEFEQFVESHHADLADKPGAESTWLISDSWFDQFAILAQLRNSSNACLLIPAMDLWRRARRLVHAPTFVLFWDPPVGEIPDVRRRVVWNRLATAYRDHLNSQLRTDPVLHVRSSTLQDAVEEGLAACLASQPA